MFYFRAIIIRIRLLFILCVYTLFLTGCFDNWCMGGGEYTTYYTNLSFYEVDDSKEAILTSTEKHTNSDWYPSINSDITNLNYTIDGIVGIYDQDKLFDRSGTSFLRDSLKLFQPIKVNYPEFRYFDGYDAYTKRKKFIFSKINSDTLVDPKFEAPHILGQANYYLYQYDITSEILDTVLVTKSSFINSDSFVTYPIYHPSYDIDGNIVFISGKQISKITTDSSQSSFYYNKFYEEAYLVRTQRKGIDTLSTLLQNTGKYTTSLKISESSIFLINNGVFTVLDYDGNVRYQQVDVNSITTSKSGKSFIIDDTFTYHNMETGVTLSIKDYFNEVNSAYPSDEHIAVLHAKKTRISDFNVNSKTSTIDISTESIMPSTTSEYAHFEYYFDSPYFINNHLSFLYLETGYYDDPDDPCD